jgi:hypothetical protein
MDVNREQLQHQAMPFSLLNVLQGPWVVGYVKNRVPRGMLSAEELWIVRVSVN